MMANSAVCRICGCKVFDPRYRKDNFKIENCLHCGLIQVTNPPPPTAIDSYYDQDFFEKHYHKLLNSPKIQDYEFRKFTYRVQEIEDRLREKGKVLDVGCSFGFFLNAARQRGWETYGVEISEFAANYAVTQLGLNVYAQTLEEVTFDKTFFDVVTLWNVIEHLENPTELVREISRIMKPGALLVLTTGNVESPLARLRKAKWRMLIPPIHLSHFSPSTIKCLLNNLGLEVIEQTSAFPYEFMLNKLGLLNLCKKLNLSDKMLVYAQKTS